MAGIELLWFRFRSGSLLGRTSHPPVQHDGARDAAQAAEGPLIQFSPDAGAGLEREKPVGLAAIAESEDKHPRAAVAAAQPIAHHGAGTVIDLGFLAARRHDHGARLSAGYGPASIARNA